MVTITPAIDQMLAATDAADSERFLKSFAENATLDDGGRVFRGRAEISRWNDNEHIGTQNRVAVNSHRRDGDEIVLDVTVTGNGYNGGGTFTVRESGGLIERLVIR